MVLRVTELLSVNDSHSYGTLDARVNDLVAGRLSYGEAVQLEEDLAHASQQDFSIITIARRATPIINRMKKREKRRVGVSFDAKEAPREFSGRRPRKPKKRSKRNPKLTKRGVSRKEREQTAVEVRGNKIRIYRTSADDSRLDMPNTSAGLSSLCLEASPNVVPSVDRLPYGKKVERRKQKSGSVYAILTGSPGSGKRR